MVALPAPMVDWSGARIEPIIAPPTPPSPAPEAPAPALESVEESTAREVASAPAVEVLEAPSPIEVAESLVEEKDNDVLSWSEPEHPSELPAAVEVEFLEIGSEPSLDGAIEAALPEPIFEQATPVDRIPSISSEGSVDFSEEEVEPTPLPRDELPVEAGVIEWPRKTSNPEWPSARTIFASQGVRGTARVPEPARPVRRRAEEPSATGALAPSSWTIPTWLGWLPTAAVALVLGSGGLALAFEWTLDGMAANLAMKMALRDEKASAPKIDPSSLPRGGWWRSTAPHRAAWAMALSRAVDGEDHTEEIRATLEAAHHASPLSSTTRFAIEPLPGPEGQPSVDFAHLGKTRDVITLTWTGRRLRQAGKIDAALRAYRSALEIASRARLQEIDAPTFEEDTVHRYRLPRESLMGTVVSDMIGAGDWTHEQWVAALPETAAAPLIASRILLRAKNRPESDRLTDLAIGRADATLPIGLDPAEHHAAVAEALAGSGRWTDAATQYRRAIDLAVDNPTRRRWWLNLAEVARRMNDDSTRARAVEAAKAADSNDEITRRALKDQQTNPGLAARGDRP
jgi:tetratricopeptide (TPR) repeat protein